MTNLWVCCIIRPYSTVAKLARKEFPVEKQDMTRNTVPEMEASAVALPRTIHLVPMDHLNGFDVRPGFYEINGATAIP